MAEHYYTVGKHGAPTPETAPHGFAFRRPGHRWTFGYLPVAINVDAEWYPLPAPPTEQAPPPEPVARWRVATSGYVESIWTRDGRPSSAEVRHAIKTLNALDRDGVAWGPGRPMSELPDGGAVLLLDDGGAFCVLPIETVRAWSVFVCWWPLPGEAAT
jgi:hypothetical protein